MPGSCKATKDVISCDKPGTGAHIHLPPDFRMESYHVAMMVLSPTYCFVEIIDNPRRFSVLACIISLVSVGVLYLILFPAIVKAFKLHRYPEHAIKQPTAEMLKKP